MTICPYCANTTWTIEALEAADANFKYYAVQCVACSKPIGVMDFENTGAGINELQNDVDALTDDLQRIGTLLNQVLNRLP